MDRTVGFIDVGTNSVHMLVVRFYEGTMGTPVYQDKEAVRLGYSLFIDGEVDEATIDKTDKVLASFAAIARSYGAEEILACATCAVRESPNADRFLQIAKRHGIKMEIIDGTEEARITRLGVLGPVSPRRTLLMDIGGGSTNVAILSMDGIVVSTHVKVGGNDYDEAIIRYVRSQFGVVIEKAAAEEIKMHVGTVYERPEERFLEFIGRDLETGLPKKVKISSEDCRLACRELTGRVVEAVHSVLEKTPPELASDVVSRGIVLVGGGCLIDGLEELLEARTGVNVVTADDPLCAVAIGTGRYAELALD
jgi:Tfp pilus assembly PilM family ATPase